MYSQVTVFAIPSKQLWEMTLSFLFLLLNNCYIFSLLSFLELEWFFSYPWPIIFGMQINDRYEFPLQLDLDRDNGKYLSPEADRRVRNLYTLHRYHLFLYGQVSILYTRVYLCALNKLLCFCSLSLFFDFLLGVLKQRKKLAAGHHIIFPGTLGSVEP